MGGKSETIDTKRRVARSETTRDINKSVVLNAIRTNQPISRADLARALGLQRSTVSSIVDEIMREGWIAEGAVAQLPRGRKPRLLCLNTERARIIGVNVMPGITTIGLADLNSKFRFQESFATAKDPAALASILAGRIRRLMQGHADATFEGIGVSLPGRVDPSTQKLVFAPNLGWQDFDMKTPLERDTGLSVSIENAANACALSEVWSGPFAGLTNLVAVTVSEGIGTGVIANGHLIRGTKGGAGEFGHVTLETDGPPCSCGSRGCWEVFASNTAAMRAYNSGVQSDSKSVARRRKGQTSASVSNFDDLLLLAARGDVTARAALDRMGRYLGLGLAMLINGLAPSVITIVGQITRAWQRIGPIVHQMIDERARSRVGTRIVPTDDILQPRLRGTVALVLEKHFQPDLLS